MALQQFPSVLGQYLVGLMVRVECHWVAMLGRAEYLVSQSHRHLDVERSVLLAFEKGCLVIVDPETIGFETDLVLPSVQLAVYLLSFGASCLSQLVRQQSAVVRTLTFVPRTVQVTMTWTRQLMKRRPGFQ